MSMISVSSPALVWKFICVGSPRLRGIPVLQTDCTHARKGERMKRNAFPVGLTPQTATTHWTPPHRRKNFLKRNWESEKQDLLISCQSLRAQFLNVSCLMFAAWCLLRDAWTPVRPIHKGFHEGGAAEGRFPLCGWVWPVFKHQAANIEKFDSKTLARNTKIPSSYKNAKNSISCWSKYFELISKFTEN